MRWKWKSFAAAAALSASLAGFAAPSPARADVSVSVSVFHTQLAPYGRWVVGGSYGNVWVPGHVSAGWAPYVDGQWIYTDYGWTWVSDDPWGDIAYHYGTWAFVEPYGWAWVPGTVWAPAWVTWAYTDDYIGWAPVPPSFSLSVGGYVGAPIVVAAPRYVFVPSHQFVGVRVNTVRVAPQQNAVIFRRASKATHFQVSNGIVRTTGLPEARVEKAMGHRVERVSIDRARTQPTTFERGGFEKAKSIPVVAPERERAKAVAVDKSDRSEKAESRNARDARPQTQARPQVQSAPPPERQAEVERKSAEPKGKPKAKPQSQQPEQREVQRSQPKAQSQQPEQREVQRSKPKAQSPESEQRQVQRSKPSERVQEAPAPRPKSQARPEPPQKPVQEARGAEPRQDARPAPKPRPDAKPKKAEKPDKPDKPGQN